jgi:hypothetical protein
MHPNTKKETTIEAPLICLSILVVKFGLTFEEVNFHIEKSKVLMNLVTYSEIQTRIDVHVMISI